MAENEIAKIVVDVCFKVHQLYGPGLFESVYEEILCYELQKRGLKIVRQRAVPVIHESIKMDAGFRVDIVVEGKVLIEIKSVDALVAVHYKQVITYLRLTNLKLGLLINFNVNLIKEGIHRIVNKL